MATSATAAAALGLRRMRPRDPDESNRTASTLELFFDLTFVVAVSLAAQQLSDREAHGAWLLGVVAFAQIFFAIWWGWLNFTWFASAFDTDDWLYRVLTIVQMAGVLVIAAGVEPVMAREDFSLVVAGYVLLRLGMVAQWVRAGRAAEYRRTAQRYVAGIVGIQLLWILQLFLVPAALRIPVFVVLVAGELAIPAIAERARTTPYHRHHIAERYGLFTLIVLGEGLLSVTNALVPALQEGQRVGRLVLLGATALVLVAGMWWTYFAREQHENLRSARSIFAFGYLHYVVFASAAAMAAGVELSIRSVTEEADVSIAARAATTVPVAVFLLAVWLIALRPSVGPAARRVLPVLAVLVAAAALLPAGVQLAAVLVAMCVVVLELDARRSGTAAA